MPVPAKGTKFAVYKVTKRRDEDITATFDIPPLDNTAMDGYAVRSSDTSGASETAPVELRVIGEVAAGYIYDGEVEPGGAVRRIVDRGLRSAHATR